MSSFINIPSSSQLPIRPAAATNSTEQQARQPYSSSQDTTQGYYRFTHTTPSIYSSSVASSNGSSVPYHGDAQPLNADKGKGKARLESVSSNAGPSVRRSSNDVAMLCRNLPPAWAQGHGRRSSLMSDSFLDVEHRVVDVGCNGRMNLITCVKASQGWDWNQDIFLPSYLCDDPMELELRQDPVTDIVLTEEERASMLP